MFNNLSVRASFYLNILYLVFVDRNAAMEIRKLLLVGCIMAGSAACAVAQTSKGYYQPTIKKSLCQ
jgi:hypothetical protein